VELLLIRHGEPVKIVEADGPVDPELAPRGQLQASRLGEYLGEEGLDALYASPMRRAQETALAVAAPTRLPVVTVEGLAEFDRFATSYIPIEEMRATKDERFLAMLEDDFSLYGIDMAEFRREVTATVEGIIGANPGRRVAAVCHGGVINAYVGHVLGMTRNSFFAPDYTSVNRVGASRSGVRSLLRLNEVGHLRGQDLLVSTL
jgi:broad specificity phosphatase PhoE